MLYTKDVKVIKSEDKKSYTAYTFEKANFEFAANDPIEPYKPTTDGKPIILPDGTTFEGTKPKNEVTEHRSAEALAQLQLEAYTYLEAVSQAERKNKKGEVVANPYTQTDGSPIPYAGELLLLAFGSNADTARIRLELDADNRAKTVDLAAIRVQQVKQLIKSGDAKDEFDAYKKIARLQAMNLQDAAEEAGQELSKADALAQIKWYQDYLKENPGTKVTLEATPATV